MMPKGWMKKMIGAMLGVCVLFCYSCNDGDRDEQHILPPEQMVKVLAEIYLTEQKINKLGLTRDSGEIEFERFEYVVFQKVGVSDSAFKRSFDYYMDHPVEM